MGLDMYANAASYKGKKQTDVKLDEKNKVIGIAYWRKFNALHGWMERLYRTKGGKAKSFNCVNVRLTTDDIEQLRKDAPTLIPTPGFFFGSYEDINNEEVQMVLAFCSKAQRELEEGNAVFYSSWW